MKKIGKHIWKPTKHFGYKTCIYCNAPYRTKTKDANCREYRDPEDRAKYAPVIDRTDEYRHPLETPQL